MGKPMVLNAEGLSEECVAAVMEHVRKSVTDTKLIESVWFDKGKRIVLELKSNVQRVVDWPRGV